MVFDTAAIAGDGCQFDREPVTPDEPPGLCFSQIPVTNFGNGDTLTGCFSICGRVTAIDDGCEFF